jgi:hypothetical protein
MAPRARLHRKLAPSPWIRNDAGSTARFVATIAPFLERLPAPARALEVALAVAVVVAVVAGVAYPLAAVRYPPIVDLPFHAAQMGALRHYYDPTFHIREQFDLRPFSVPYLSLYLIGAILMTVLPMVSAMKVAAGLMLLLLPAGLAVLFHGMKKSPLLGAAGLLAVWGPLTHWGFLNHIGALGLFAMVVGLSLLVVDGPSCGRRAALGAVLVALFFTHVVRYPFAIAAVIGVALVMKPWGARGLRAVLPVVLPAGAFFVIWWALRPASLRATPQGFSLAWERLGEFSGWLWGAFDDPREPRALVFGAATLAMVGLSCGVAGAIERRSPRWTGPPPSYRAGAALVALGAVGASLLLYLTVPMQIGDWWYVYPREATAACFLGLALLPDLPRALSLRAALALATVLASLPMVRVVAENYAAFDAATADFATITRELPRAPKLLYLIFDHSGSTRTTSPFTHLPAYVQAERGGSLSYHFAIYGASSLAYRPREGREDIVPPPTPPLWESTPEAFDVLDRGRFFDWFLVRRADSPDAIFEADPTIVLQSHVGKWWLYRRRAASGEASLGG